ERLAPLLPGAHGVIYDTALRGVHHQHLLRNLGWLTINRVTAAQASTPNTPRRRIPKSAHVETKTITLPDGTRTAVQLYASDGAIGVGELDDRGDLTFVPLPASEPTGHKPRTGNTAGTTTTPFPQSS